ncbi:TetR/AcrR family transcriptional regulator [Bacteroides sp.]|uniref:TetR/AcrR family transcriptional regulator n=1 Tax=Bacteroides sp. TaxID=29523 RepID=UPI0023CEA786|nr:TetR/AcrR family transcriptional regulator [Bacteroides sp.]MDE5710159.1 TetR/AcrR family transcriptional regulator [Bacteroides sp.]MDE5760967.1 TetR/AcrR family transcriptional regulator [Bacteroides sp.]MDE6216371.1 TetR/AcrR family transcriptional regulator [Bacteroides sp.]
MGEHTRHFTSRSELKERIINVASEAFSASGIKCVTMDEIAASLGISKRTLYEVFPDKETLLEACILKVQGETDTYIEEVLQESDNVLEVLLKLYQHSIEKFHATNKKFFEEIKKYPKAYEAVRRDNNRNHEDAISFFRQGVVQGFFRDDVNFAIVGVLVRKQLDVLMETDLCEKFSFLEVYESIMFTFLRGISTEKGAAELEDFIYKYRKKQLPVG